MSAVESSNASKWKEACTSEFKSLTKNETRELVVLPRGQNAISSKCVYKVNQTADGLIGIAHCKRFSAEVRSGL